MPVAIASELIAQHASRRETVTLLHLSRLPGAMKYMVSIVGGRHDGIDIRCATKESAQALFRHIVSCVRLDLDHPYLTAI